MPDFSKEFTWRREILHIKIKIEELKKCSIADKHGISKWRK